MPVFLTCQICGKEFWKSNRDFNRSQHHYCSRKCTYKGKQNREKRKCPVCKELFEVAPSKEQTYCSAECRNESKGVDLICHNCGKLYRVSPGHVAQRKYCSKACTYADKRGKSNVKLSQKVLCKCTMCGKEFYRAPSAVTGKKLYCSRECRKNPIEYECQICGKIFTASLSSKRKYCNRECQFESMKRKIKCQCPTCGKVFERYPSYIKKRTRVYCSRACTPPGWTFSPNRLEKFIDSLTPLNIRFVGDGNFWLKTSAGLRNPDFKVKGEKKLIEVFGNHWHPSSDEEALRQLYEEIGYMVLILWESEIKENLDGILDKIGNFIGQKTWQLSLPLG